MARKHVILGKPKTLFQGKIITVKAVPALMPDGTKKIYEYAYRDPIVAVLAFNKQKQLLVTREYRERYQTYAWHLPAGRADKSGGYKQNAIRELREEAGYRPKRIRLVFQTRKNYSWPLLGFVASDLQYDPLPKEVGEDIRVVPMSLTKAEKLALTDGFVDPLLSLFVIKAAFIVRTKSWKALLGT